MVFVGSIVSPSSLTFFKIRICFYIKEYISCSFIEIYVFSYLEGILIAIYLIKIIGIPVK